MNSALDSFRCSKDEDIESFLRFKSLEFLKRRLCSIYLILDEQKFDSGHIQIEAYFTLSHKSIISEGISTQKIKKISGGLKQARALSFVLIGQLGKRIKKLEDGKFVSSNISAAEILDFAFEIIREASNLIPCRFVLIECSDNKKVQQVYINYGFTELQKDENHYQFTKKI